MNYLHNSDKLKSISSLNLKKTGSGYRTTRGSLNLKTYSTTSCNMTPTNNENAVGLVEKGKPKTKP